MYLERAKGADPSATLISRGGMVEVMAYMTRRNTETTAAMLKVLNESAMTALEVDGRKAFEATFQSGHTAIVQRVGRARLPVKSLMAPAVPMLYGKTYEEATQDYYSILQKHIQREVERVLDGFGSAALKSGPEEGPQKSAIIKIVAGVAHLEGKEINVLARFTAFIKIRARAIVQRGGVFGASGAADLCHAAVYIIADQPQPLMDCLIKAVRRGGSPMYLFVPFPKRVPNRAMLATDRNKFGFFTRENQEIRNRFTDRFTPLSPLYRAQFACFAYRMFLFPLAICNQGSGEYDTTAK